MKSLTELAPTSLATGANIKGNVMIDSTAVVDPTAEIGPNVVIGANCKVGPHSKISNSTLMAGSTVGTASYVDGSIIGWKSTVNNWCRVTALTVIAEDV